MIDGPGDRAGGGGEAGGEAPAEAREAPGTEVEAGPEGVETGLARDMGLLHVTMIGVGAMIGAGIFVLTGLAAGEAGPALVIVFLLNGLVTTLTALSYAELGSCFPEAGGGYLWVKEALPQPNGFLSGWMSWFAHAVACSLYCIAFGAFATEVLHMAGIAPVEQLGLPLIGSTPEDAATKYIAILIGATFTYINYRGAEETGIAETAVTILKMIVIGLFLGFGLWAIFTDPARADWPQHFVPFFPRGAGGVITAMGLTFIAFEGYEIIAQCGEEVVDPKRNIPRSIFISLAIVVPVYILVAFVALGAISAEQMPTWQVLGAQKELAMVEAAQEFMPYGKLIFLIGGLFSTMSALNATIYSSARVSFAMGRDHNFPDVFARIHPVRRTPHWATIISGIFIVVMAVTLPIEDVASATDVMFLLLFLLVNLSVINLRRNRPDLDRGFVVPWSPAIPLVASALNVFLAGYLFFYSPRGLIVSGGYVILGVAIYFAYARSKERAAKATPVVHHEVPVAEEGVYRVLLPVANPETARDLVDFACELARDEGGDLVLLNVIQVPAQLPPQEGRRFRDSALELLSDARNRAEEQGVPVHTLVRIGHNVAKAIIETADDKGADLVVVGWEGEVRRRDRVFGTVLDELAMNATCDVAMVRRAPSEPVERVVVPITEIEPALLSLQIADSISVESRPVELVHLVEAGYEESARERIQANLEEALGEEAERFRLVVRTVTEEGLAETLLQAVEDSDLVVMGAPQEGLVQRAMFGDVPETVAKRIEVPVILTKRYTGAVKSWVQQLFGVRKTFLQ